MLQAKTSNQFKKDFKAAQKRSKDISKLKIVMRLLVEEKPLETGHRDHPLTGNYKGRRECHIESDWLLVYRIDKKDDIIVFERTGTHSDLFE
jgi:mRNA interferase YafQ